MRVPSTMYESRGDVEPTVGPIVQLGTLDAASPVRAPPASASWRGPQPDAPVVGVQPLCVRGAP